MIKNEKIINVIKKDEEELHKVMSSLKVRNPKEHIKNQELNFSDKIAAHKKPLPIERARDLSDSSGRLHWCLIAESNACLTAG